ncbi:MAG: GTP pyrophosphokinase family protein [Eubacteriaceae bacterium]|jgi:putative GTP pyrophosphokinase|nr:GTP pyrophosphokinase family protein [Eubacteriaceae bacterium]
MLNEKISDVTPMADILKHLYSEYPKESVELYRIANQMMKDFAAIENNYVAAIREVNTRLEILSDEFQSLHQRNPIHTIKSRVKSSKSIVEKLWRRGYEINKELAIEKIEDIAGIRVICPYIEDIYTIQTLLLNQDDIELLCTKDYIKKPKDNGYRSLHLIISVPVFFSDHKEMVKVEVQIRTIAMDFWASLEHEIRYKTIEEFNIPSNVSDELKECAEIIAEVDLRMQNIHNFVIE